MTTLWTPIAVTGPLSQSATWVSGNGYMSLAQAANGVIYLGSG